MKFWSITGNSQKLDGGAMFGNAPKAVWENWVNVDEQNRIDLACRALLVSPLNGKTVLFETGIGAFFEPKLRQRYGVQESQHVLIESLRQAGFEHEDIDVVVLSHLHFDHAGGLLAPWSEGRAPELLFPNATYIVGENHWQRALNPHPRDKASFIPELTTLLKNSGRLELISGEYSNTLGNSVRFSYSQGHTPGLMLAEILFKNKENKDSGIVFCADLIPGKSWVHIPITMGYDRNAELLIDEKKLFLMDKKDRNIKLFFTHDTDYALADIMCDEKGRFSTCNEIAELNAYSF